MYTYRSVSISICMYRYGTRRQVCQRKGGFSLCRYTFWMHDPQGLNS